jgi:hypothetical protein
MDSVHKTVHPVHRFSNRKIIRLIPEIRGTL